MTHGEPRNPTRKSKERLWSLLAYRCAAPRIYPDNPHVRICGGPGSATTLVYPTLSWCSGTERLRKPRARAIGVMRRYRGEWASSASGPAGFNWLKPGGLDEGVRNSSGRGVTAGTARVFFKKG